MRQGSDCVLMGLTITATNSKYEFDMGYGGFYNLRKNIAFALDKEFGENYAQLGSCFSQRQFEHNDKIAQYIITKNHLADNYSDVIMFLYASDTDGSISHKTCRSIYELIKDVDFGNAKFRYATCAGDDYEEFKAFLKECSKKRHKMRWY